MEIFQNQAKCVHFFLKANFEEAQLSLNLAIRSMGREWTSGKEVFVYSPLTSKSSAMVEREVCLVQLPLNLKACRTPGQGVKP